jgi:hypothetical protein
MSGMQSFKGKKATNRINSPDIVYPHMWTADGIPAIRACLSCFAAPRCQRQGFNINGLGVCLVTPYDICYSLHLLILRVTPFLGGAGLPRRLFQIPLILPPRYKH